jgi:DinB superfamily
MGQGEYDPVSVTGDSQHGTSRPRGCDAPVTGGDPGGRSGVEFGGTVGSMDLQAWLLDSHADLRRRLFGAVVSQVPTERWHKQADGGGSSIAWLLLHLARHQDLAVTTVIRNKAPLYLTHAPALGLADAPPSAGLGERENTAVSAAVSLDALVTYVDATFDATERWLKRFSAMALAVVPDTPRRLRTKAVLDPDELDWLFGMWSGHTVDWFVQWPVLGHGQGHVGEAIAVRNRMGLSPF